MGKLRFQMLIYLPRKTELPLDTARVVSRSDSSESSHKSYKRSVYGPELVFLWMHL